MDTQLLQNKDLTEGLHLDQMPEAEREEFMQELGFTILQSSVIKLMSVMSEEQIADLEKFMAENSEEDDLFAKMTERYPGFEQILEEEIKNVRGDLEQVAASAATS